MTLTRFADGITLSSTRAALSLSKWTADPLAAGIERCMSLRDGALPSKQPPVKRCQPLDGIFPFNGGLLRKNRSQRHGNGDFL